MKQRPDAIILTCEHGGNRVPRHLTQAFKPLAGMLATHRGWDPGALALARRLSRRFRAPLFESTTSRLVVDLNRSEHHPRVFSRVSGSFPAAERTRLLDSLYRPFRSEVAAAVREATNRGRKVVHISVHSFTPVLAGVRRNADIGLLYDPKSETERAVAAAWRSAIRSINPDLLVRMNYPYRGTADGHTTSLRGRFQPDRYVGIELEVNQKLVRLGGATWARTQACLVDALARALASEPGSTA